MSNNKPPHPLRFSPPERKILMDLIQGGGTLEDLKKAWDKIKKSPKVDLERLQSPLFRYPVLIECLLQDCMAPSGPSRSMAMFFMDQGAVADQPVINGFDLRTGFHQLYDSIRTDGSNVDPMIKLDNWVDYSGRYWGWLESLEIQDRQKNSNTESLSSFLEWFKFTALLSTEVARFHDTSGSYSKDEVLKRVDSILKQGIHRWGLRPGADVNGALKCFMEYWGTYRQKPIGPSVAIELAKIGSDVSSYLKIFEDDSEQERELTQSLQIIFDQKNLNSVLSKATHDSSPSPRL